eukprot:GGOE01054994.1.p1 GENE.GGOE01054994.1~~GGOE01054994.1.p1  ORF type:complete len:558 (+),score=127.92 GGOE01054994.1:90-1763(+)
MAGWISCLSSLFLESPLVEVGIGAVHNEVTYRRSEATARELHADAKGCNVDCFKQSFQQAERHQDATIRLAVEQHSQNLHQQQLLYDKQRDYEERLAAREARRDMWDQKTEQTSTLLLLNTLMFSCLFNIMTQGFPPDATEEVWLWVFSITMAISFGSLFVSILYALSLQLAMSQYRIDNPSKLYTCGTRHLMFYSFWKCHCANFSRAAYIAFSIGTCSLATNACILVHLRFAVQFKSVVSTIIFQCLALGLAPFLFFNQRRHFLKLLQGAAAESHDTSDVYPVCSYGLYRTTNGMDINTTNNPLQQFPIGTVAQPELEVPGLASSDRMFSVDLEVPDASTMRGEIRPPIRLEEPTPESTTSPCRPPNAPGLSGVPFGAASSSGNNTPNVHPIAALPTPQRIGSQTRTAAPVSSSAPPSPRHQTSGVVEGKEAGNGELKAPRARRGRLSLADTERELDSSLSLTMPSVHRHMSIGSSTDTDAGPGPPILSTMGPALVQALALEVEVQDAAVSRCLSLRGHPPPLAAPPDIPLAQSTSTLPPPYPNRSARFPRDSFPP